MSKFKEYATSTALSVSVSRAQVEVLCAIHQGFILTEVRSFLTSLCALEKKGLVERVPKHNDDRIIITWKWVLTKAGKIIIDLINEADIYIYYRADDDDSEFGVKI